MKIVIDKLKVIINCKQSTCLDNEYADLLTGKHFKNCSFCVIKPPNVCIQNKSATKIVYSIYLSYFT